MSTTPIDFSQFVDASGGADVGGAGYTDQGSTVDSGSSSGVAGLDWGGLITDIGTTVGNVYKAVNGPQITRLPNGQVVLPSGQVVAPTPVFSSQSSGLFLLVAFGLLVLVLVRK